MLGLEKSTITLLDKPLFKFFLIRGTPALWHWIFDLISLIRISSFNFIFINPGPAISRLLHNLDIILF